jgi:hypothetical protein
LPRFPYLLPSIMFFDEVTRRVFTALSVENKLRLQSAIASRTSTQALRFLSGSEVSESERFKIFKHALISIYNVRNEDREFNSALHLIRILIDSMSIESAKQEQNLGQDLQVSKDAGKRQIEPKKKRKTKKSKVQDYQSMETATISGNDNNISTFEEASSEIDRPLTEVSIGMAVEDTTPLPPSMSATDLAQDDRIEPITESLKSKKSRKRNRRSKDVDMASASPSSPANKRASSLLGAGRDDMSGPSEVAFAHWQFVNGLIRTNKVNDLLARPPSDFGFKCTRDKTKNCQYCVASVIMAPVTTCEAVGCKESSHESFDFVFPHQLNDFSIPSLHDMDTLGYYDILERMFKQELVPSIHYVCLHDMRPDKVVSVRRFSSTFKKTVDHYMK